MRRLLVPSCVLLLAALPAPAQDWKGYGRVEGRVLDAVGKPVAKVKVTLNLPARGGGGPRAQTDAKGRWAAAGLAAGTWEVDYEAEGFATFKGRFDLPNEQARLLPLEVRLRHEGPAGVPPEVAAALQGAEAAEKEGRFADARAGYEKLIALRPDVAAVAHQRIGASYIQEKQYGLALDHFEKALAADPGNPAVRLILAQTAFEGGLAERGVALAAAVDRALIQDPDAAYNLGVHLVNANRPAEAAAFFSRAIALDARYVDGYLRRGLAELNLGQTAEARADLLKVIELQPDGPQAELAKKAVEALK